MTGRRKCDSGACKRKKLLEKEEKIRNIISTNKKITSFWLKQGKVFFILINWFYSRNNTSKFVCWDLGIREKMQ